MRHRQRRLGLACGLLVLLLSACGAGASAPDTPPAPPSALAVVTADQFAGAPPATFIALDDQGGVSDPPVALYDAATGKVISRILGGSLAGMSIVGLALDASGSLWVTYSRGPVYQNDTFGGDPKPDSCGNDVVRVDLATGRSTTVLSTGDNEVVDGAWPSPDGRYYAYMSSGCANSYFNGHLTVVDIATGRSWTIGAALQRCHSLSQPAWTLDSRSLVFAYGAAAPLDGMPLGGCPPPHPAQLVEVNALAGQGGIAGTSASPDPTCNFSSATVLTTGPVGLEQCNVSSTDQTGNYIDGPARLVVFDAQLHAQGRVPIGECNDGSELAADQAGSAVLVSAYLYCPGTTQPVTRLWSYSTTGLKPIAQVPGDGDPIGDITW